MNKEAIELIEAIRKALVDHGKQQKGSAKKKTRKITSQLIWDPAPYLDALDDILRTSKTEQEVVERSRSLMRSAEEAALKTGRVTETDTGHHIVQSRTGGDALTELPYQRTGPIVSKLSDKHQMFFGNRMGPDGNLPPEMFLSNFAHKADDKATGLERESGIGKNPDKSTTAHQKGTAAFANMKGIDLTDDAAIFENLDQKVTEQKGFAQTAAQTDAPRQEYLRQATGNPDLYKGSAPKELVTDPDIVKQSFLQLTNGQARLNPKALAAAGLALPSMLGMAASAAETKMRTDKAIETGNPLDKLQAGIAGTSLAADAVPGVGEVVSTPADLANVAIDEGREAFEDPMAYTKRAVERTAQTLVPLGLGKPVIKAVKGGMKLLFK